MDRETVCIIHHTGADGGGTKSFLDVVDMLRRDFRVIGCIPMGYDKLKERLLALGVEVREIKYSIPVFLRYSGGESMFSLGMLRSFMSMRFIKSLVKDIESLEPDVVIFNSIVTSISAPFFAEKIRKICIVRETIVHRFSGRIFRYILEKYVNGVCYLAEIEKTKMDLVCAETAVIPDCVPEENIVCMDMLEARRAEGIAQDEFVFLYMGGTRIIKGGEVALDAAARLGEGYRLLFAGGFDDKMFSFQNMIKHWYSVRYLRFVLKLRNSYLRASKANNVTFIGFRHDLSSIMNACNVVVFPSTFVHQPRPCIEAGYYGKPAILSDYEETREFFIDGYNALTFQPGDGKDLARKLRYAKEHEATMNEMGKNNKLMSQSKHDYKATQEKLYQFLYRQIRG